MTRFVRLHSLDAIAANNRCVGFFSSTLSRAVCNSSTEISSRWSPTVATHFGQKVLYPTTTGGKDVDADIVTRLSLQVTEGQPLDSVRSSLSVLYSASTSRPCDVRGVTAPFRFTLDSTQTSNQKYSSQKIMSKLLFVRRHRRRS